MECQGTCWEKRGMGNSTEGECRKHLKLQSSRSSSSSPHFPLTLGKSHQLLCRNCFQHIFLQSARLVTVLLHSWAALPWILFVLDVMHDWNVIPAKRQLSKQKSFSPADLYQFRIWPGCLLHRKHSKRRGEHNQTQTLAWTQKIIGLEKPNTSAANISQGKCCSSDWPLANCPARKQKASLCFTSYKNHQNHFYFKSIKTSLKKTSAIEILHDNDN